MDGERPPFWETKTLEELSPSEWESLCDGCARCCLVKLEDEETGIVHLTRIGCRLLDPGTCRCKNYPKRHELVSDCIGIDPEKVRQIEWLPQSCAYRRIAEGRGLAWWHPLVSGDPNTVHEAGISVRGWVRNEDKIKEENYHRYIIKSLKEA